MTKTAYTSDEIVDLIGDIFLRRGADSYLGEQVTMSEHMLQAALLAEQEGAEDALIAAALLHDIGHYLSEFGENSFAHGIDNHHDAAGARVLEGNFPPLVVECVRLHVAAKRYLCATDPTYFGRLSPASVHTLSLQGGPMDAREVAVFAANPFHLPAIRVRIWDEGSKIAGHPTPDFAHYEPLLRRVAGGSTAPG